MPGCTLLYPSILYKEVAEGKTVPDSVRTEHSHTVISHTSKEYPRAVEFTAMLLR